MNARWMPFPRGSRVITAPRQGVNEAQQGSSPGSYRRLFGPVASRRLGRSLGIDLVPLKTCTFDCVFCQAGRTDARTVTRREFVPVADVTAELDRWIAAGGEADTITLSGSGEPTLHLRFGDVLRAVAARMPTRKALLTNGSLLHDAAVRADAALADVVKISLGCWDERSLDRLNRPHPDVDFRRMLDGMREFRRRFAGELWLEVFAVHGLNDTEEAMRRIAGHVKTILPDCVQLNTVVRPPADPVAVPVAEEQLRSLALLFEPRAEVIARVAPCTDAGNGVGRRPVIEGDVPPAVP